MMPCMSFARFTLMLAYVFLLLLSTTPVSAFSTPALPRERPLIKKSDIWPFRDAKRNGEALTNGSATTTKAPSETWQTTSTKIPFLIEQVPQKPNPSIYSEIADMCIDAFFNEPTASSSNKNIPPWKSWQLGYLRTLQSNDLRRRRSRDRDGSNFMLVARAVVPADPVQVQRSTPLILDLSKVCNLSSGNSGGDFVRGQVLGFVEVTRKPYGLGRRGGGESANGYDDQQEEERAITRKSSFYDKRPLLTNLSVRYEARRSGVGSRLVEACEQEVIKRWSNQREIILEVEDDNDKAIEFYKKRGYKILFEDPASRRYDTSSIFLQQVRCTRLVMRKSLSFFQSHPLDSDMPEQVKSSFSSGVRALRRLRDNVFSSTTTTLTR